MKRARDKAAALAAGARGLDALCREYREKRATVRLEQLAGGALPFYAAAAVGRVGGVHLFVAEDRDAAAYLLNDFYALLDERRVLFFPASYKRSIAYGAEDAQGVVQRTATLDALRRFAAGENAAAGIRAAAGAPPSAGTGGGGDGAAARGGKSSAGGAEAGRAAAADAAPEGPDYLVVCTYPEALAERVADACDLQRETIRVAVGDRITPELLVEALVDAGFERVDFVYEPGQYSLRGGIVDVFSYSESKPFRVDFFGDEVDSIRRFNISSQLSEARLAEAGIVPNLNAREARRVSLARFAGAEASFWFYDAEHVLQRVNEVRRKLLGDLEDPSRIDYHVTSRNGLLATWPKPACSCSATTSRSVPPLRRWPSTRRPSPNSTSISRCWPTTWCATPCADTRPTCSRKTSCRSSGSRIFCAASAADRPQWCPSPSRCTRGSWIMR